MIFLEKKQFWDPLKKCKQQAAVSPSLKMMARGLNIFNLQTRPTFFRLKKARDKTHCRLRVQARLLPAH